MIQHTVLFRLKDNSPQQCAETRDILLSMDGRVPMLRGIEVHVDELHSARSYDVALTVLLDDWQALEDYQQDPYHCGTVKAYLAEAAASSICLDCSVN